nr:hypothetical protein [Tanacetum cinerariifolium]
MCKSRKTWTCLLSMQPCENTATETTISFCQSCPKKYTKKRYSKKSSRQYKPILISRRFCSTLNQEHQAESGTLERGSDLDVSGNPEPRREGPESPRKKDPKIKTMFKRLEKGVFHKLGDKGKSMSAYSNDSRRQSYHNSRRDTESYYQSSRSRGTEPSFENIITKECPHTRRKLYQKAKVAQEDTRSQGQKAKRGSRRSPQDLSGSNKSRTLGNANMVPHVQLTHTGSARVWFDHIPHESVDSYDDLKEAFLANFRQQKKCIKYSVNIHHIKQREGESTKDFVRRFKRQIEELLKNWKLSHTIKELKQNSGKDQPKINKKGETSSKDKALAILMVQPWQMAARQRITQSFPPDPEVSFSPLNEEEGTKRPMIIEAEIGGHFIHRIDEEHSPSAWMNFVVLRSSSLCNGLIRRPGVRMIQAVPSTAHEMLKFPVAGGILILKSSKIIPIECAAVSGSEGQPLAAHQAIEEIIKVAINPYYPKQTIMSGSTLTEEGRNKLCDLLQRNLDMFAWKPVGMTGVPRHVAEHRLNIQEGCPPGYHQIKMAKEDEEKTTFITNQGVFCYSKMPFDLRNTGATYQRLVDKAFHKQIGQESRGFDQSQPPQFPVIHPPPQETSIKILHDQEKVINVVQTFLRKFNRYSFFETPKVLLLAWDKVFKIKDAFRNEQYKPEDVQELFHKLLNDVQNIHKKLAEYINTPGWNRPAFHDDDDDDDVDYTIAITPILSTEKPDNSLSMRDEHLDTIPATESDEVIKSSVEDLVPIPSESEGIPDTMCDVHLANNPIPLEAKDHFEIVINSNDDYSSSDEYYLYESIEYVEASPHDSELVSLEVDKIVIPEDEEIEDDNLRAKLLKYEAFSFYDDHIKEISSGSTITHSDISLCEYDSFTFDLWNDQFPPTDRSDFTHEEFADELAHIISPPKYDCFYFRNLPDPGEWISILNSGIRENLSSPTRVNLPLEDDHSSLLAYVVNLLIAEIEALKDNLTPSSEFLTKSSSTSPKPFLEGTDTFDNSLPEFKNFCFDLEEISSGSTTTHSDISLPDYEAFYLYDDHMEKISSGSTTTHSDISLPEYEAFSFYDDHIEEISSGSTTSHSDISLSEYDLFIFDLSNDQFPPTDRSDFTHEEFADELAHIISPPEYDCFYFRNLPDPGEWISILNFGICENLSSTTRVNLPVEDDHSPLLAYVVWIFLAYLTYPVIPPYIYSFGNEDTIFDPCITINRFYSFKPGLSHRSGTFKKFNTHRSHLNESPMEMFFSTLFLMDQ